MATGFVIVTLPQMLAEQGLSGSRIPIAVALISSPSFFSFLLAPFLDVRFRRRTYATVFGVLAAAATSWVVLDHHSAAEVEAVMFIGFLCLMLFASAQAGWAGSLIERVQASALGAWGTAYNIAGGGAGILLSGYASERFSPPIAAACLFPLLLAPLARVSADPGPSA